jgi:hypothetical protein
LAIRGTIGNSRQLAGAYPALASAKSTRPMLAPMVLLSEVGPHVSRFPTVKHFTSWLGLSPQHQSTIGPR